MSFSACPLPLTLPNNSGGALVPDVNGDNYADFAISDGAYPETLETTVIFY